MIPPEDMEWLETKRMEVVRLAEKCDQRTWDAPRYLRIIDDLLRRNVCFVEIGRLTEEESDELDKALS
jgi:hypothetical protein